MIFQIPISVPTWQQLAIIISNACFRKTWISYTVIQIRKLEVSKSSFTKSTDLQMLLLEFTGVFNQPKELSPQAYHPSPRSLQTVRFLISYCFLFSEGFSIFITMINVLFKVLATMSMHRRQSCKLILCLQTLVSKICIILLYVVNFTCLAKMILMIFNLVSIQVKVGSPQISPSVVHMIDLHLI